jgi:hypothetical protein
MFEPAKRMRGPFHSAYLKVVSPLKMTYIKAIRYFVIGIWATEISMYLGAVIQVGKVESLAGRDSDVVQDNGRAGLLASAGTGSRVKGAG